MIKGQSSHTPVFSDPPRRNSAACRHYWHSPQWCTQCFRHRIPQFPHGQLHHIRPSRSKLSSREQECCFDPATGLWSGTIPRRWDSKSAWGSHRIRCNRTDRIWIGKPLAFCLRLFPPFTRSMQLSLHSAFHQLNHRSLNSIYQKEAAVSH